MKKQALIQVIDDALSHTEALIDAANGNESRCKALDPMHGPALTEAQRHGVRLYVESWIENPLRLALVLALEQEAVSGRQFSIQRAVEFLRDRSRFGERLRKDPGREIEELV